MRSLKRRARSDRRRPSLASASHPTRERIMKHLLGSVLPLQMIYICWRLLYNGKRGPWRRDIHIVEFFAGTKAITSAGLRASKLCVAFEIKDDKTFMDFVGSKGFLHAVLLALRTRQAGFIWMAPLCSTWR